MRTSLFSLLLCLIIISCENDEDKKPACQNTYITRLNLNTSYDIHLLYNTAGLLVQSYEIYDLFAKDTVLTYTFHYDAHNRLTEVDASFLEYKVTYDGSGRAAYALRKLPNTQYKFTDSITFEYDSENRFTRYNWYGLDFEKPGVDRNSGLRRYNSFTYNSDGTVHQELFVTNEGIYPELKHVVTRNISYDSKRKPFPSELDIFYEVTAENPVVGGNIVAMEFINITSGTSETFTTKYEYNAAGYPVKIFYAPADPLVYEYSCEPRTEL